MQIIDLKTPGVVIQMPVFCLKATVGTTTSNQKYLNIIFRDASGTVNAKLWNASDQDIKSLKQGKAFTIQASTNMFKQNIQLKIIKYQQIANEDLNNYDLVPKAPINVDEFYQEIVNTVNNFSNESYCKILKNILEEYGNDFKTWPAAVFVHHAVMHGLLWHTGTMLKTAKSLSIIYEDRNIDWELLYSGIILHDLGKILEINNFSANSDSMTLEGKLIGHISIMQAEIHRIANSIDVDEEAAVLLQHMIIASHGKLEFGSPVVPHLLEAEILSFLDNMDAKIYTIDNVLKPLQKNEHSNIIGILDQRWFLKHFSK